MNIKEAIKQYLIHVKHSKSKGMYQFESSHLTVVLAYLEDKHILAYEDITKDIIYQLIMYLKVTRKNSNKTINKKINAMKRVTQYHNIECDVLSSHKKLIEVKKRFNLIQEEDLKRVLAFFDSIATSDKTAMEKLILYLLYDTGVRLNELLHIEITHIDLKNNQILLTTTKTKTERIVFFTNATLSLLKRIIHIPPQRSVLLWNLHKNIPYTKESIRALFKRITNRCQIGQIHPHMFRHTFATRMIEAGMPITSVQMLLGHSSIKTTEVYLHLSLKKVKESYFQIVSSLEQSSDKSN
jgi:site-specific recombinase XerD